MKLVYHIEEPPRAPRRSVPGGRLLVGGLSGVLALAGVTYLAGALMWSPQADDERTRATAELLALRLFEDQPEDLAAYAAELSPDLVTCTPQPFGALCRDATLPRNYELTPTKDGFRVTAVPDVPWSQWQWVRRGGQFWYRVDAGLNVSRAAFTGSWPADSANGERLGNLLDTP